jgi:hypothetical protein
VPQATKSGFLGLGRADWLALLVMAAVIISFAHEYVDPRRAGIPVGIDLGNDLAYLGTLRSELRDSGRLLTWWSVAYDGIPLIGHPNSQFFYPPLILPSLALGTTGGVRTAYVFSLLLAGVGMYLLARLLGSRPAVAAWGGLLFAMSGGLAARIHAGHLQKVLAFPFIPVVLAFALLVGRARSWRVAALWGVVTGLFHGFTFLAGDTYIPLFLLFAVPIIFTIAVRGDGGKWWRDRLPLALAAWATGLVLATAGKLIAAVSVLSETVRTANPYFGSQDSYWFIVHLAFPFFSGVPGLPFFSYGREQVRWGWGGWEYTQYIGVVPVVLALLAIGALVFEWRRRQIVVNYGLRPREVAALIGVVLLAVLWLANAKSYSPVHWLFEAVPQLQDFRVPSRALMLAVPVFLALAAVGLDALFRSNSGRFRTLGISLGVLALGGAWWVNTSWFTPVQWSCAVVPGLNGVPLPACTAVLAVIAILILVAFGLWIRRLTSPLTHRLFVASFCVVALLALADVVHATQATPRVREMPVVDSVRRVAEELQKRDSGPFLVGLGSSNRAFAGGSGMYVNKAVRLQFAERGIAVADNVSPLVPEHQSQHQVIGLDMRLRYRVMPSDLEPPAREGWSRLIQDGGVVVLVNDKAQGDAWLINDREVTPLKVSDWAPGRFEVRTSAPAGATLAVPANAFPGWRVSVDGGPSRPAAEFDGYAAVTTEAGYHTYQLVYKAPLLPLILVLGTLPWILGIFLLIWGVYYVLRNRSVQPELSGNHPDV